MSTERVCIFPLPGTAVLPFQTIQLHIFEPRYIAMVKHCLETDALMAVALKTPGAEAEHASVFSAGKIRVLEEFEDGRMLVESTAQARYKLKSIVQQIPFLVGECEKTNPGHIDNERWKMVTSRMRVLLDHHFAALDRELLSLSESNDIKFFHLLSRFQWPAEEVQKLLEIETVNEMADSLLKTLHGVELVTSGDSSPTLH